MQTSEKVNELHHPADCRAIVQVSVDVKLLFLAAVVASTLLLGAPHTVAYTVL